MALTGHYIEIIAEHLLLDYEYIEQALFKLLNVITNLLIKFHISKKKLYKKV
jgi:hypothetical protein